uniref:Cell division protein FtsX n=1 Tax=candidate division CPR3 bacterium TaxID=2268181 RepID=A0A7C4R2R5_UNCC3
MFSFKLLKNAAQSIIRNKWLTFATVTVMTLTLFTISVFIVLNLLVNSTIETVKSKIDLEVYFKDEVTEDMILDIKKEVSKLPEVKEAQYITKEDAVKIFKEKYKGDSSLSEAVSETPDSLPASLRIGFYKAEDIETINKMFRGGKYDAVTDDTSYENNGNTINALIAFSSYIKKGGLGLSLVFLITSLIVVLNTIRMTMYTRREEIEIMKLVGATNWYIRWPFVLEGAFYGFISMIIASIALLICFKFGGPYLIGYLEEFSVGFVDALNNYGIMILLWQFAVSVFVGVVSASIAIGRYLRV